MCEEEFPAFGRMVRCQVQGCTGNHSAVVRRTWVHRGNQRSRIYRVEWMTHGADGWLTDEGVTKCGRDE